MATSIPFGYSKQVLSSPATTDGGGGYISDTVLAKWMKENRSGIGKQSSYGKNASGAVEVIVSRPLTEDEIDTLRRLSNPKMYDISTYFYRM
ncbi:hypothetical protein IFR05_008371 [Cadophora sp. M221]|nr:hypothetical protein IFR05_008371 [Cadophora sp. M221]